MSKIFYFLFIFYFISLIKGEAQNLVSNGDFESGAIGWSNMAGGGGVATFTCPVTGGANVHAGTNALRSTITAVGANAWDVQTIHSGFTATIGLAHTFTFWAKASVAGRQVRMVIQNATYTAQNYTLTAAWAQYTFNFTPTEASLQLKIHYTQTGDFFFDDFSIPDVSGGPSLITTTITPTTSYQQMIGFGGALTWYADRVISSANQTAICDLIFLDSGIDILRLKNWYYPINYPTNKSITTMDPAHFKNSFDITNQLYMLAKSRNSNIDVLLCSWSPPKAFKTNNALPEGTLTKNAGQFMYKEHAQYWVDILNNITFTPDYISMQNEPGYVNPGWETCEWRPTETATFPGYDKGLDSLWKYIKDRPNVPKILAPEPENLGAAGWDAAANTFRAMADPIKTKPYLYGYAYHLYNYAGGAGSISPTNLNIIRDEFNNHPNFMTEFSSENYNWIDVARMVHANLVEANTNAYIYWELIWDNASSSAMVGMDNAGNYTIKDNYYSIKHFSKYVDKGYTRIAATGSNATLNLTAFKNPAGNQITLVAINNHVSAQPLNFSLAGGSTILSAQAYQSVASNYWQNLGTVNLSTTQNLPGKSLTTYVINTTPLPVCFLSCTAKRSDVDALIEWKTGVERDNDFFEVQHSIDGQKFDSVGIVYGKGNTGKPQFYKYLHSGINTNKQYYRLRQVDYSGMETFSEIVHIEALNQLDSPKVFPNPFQQKLSIQLGKTDEASSIRIYNDLGKVYYEGFTREDILTLETENFPKGLYFIEVKKGKQAFVLKAVKL